MLTITPPLSLVTYKTNPMNVIERKLDYLGRLKDVDCQESNIFHKQKYENNNIHKAANKIQKTRLKSRK